MARSSTLDDTLSVKSSLDNCCVIVDPPPPPLFPPSTVFTKTLPRALKSIPECSKNRSSSVAIRAFTTLLERESNGTFTRFSIKNRPSTDPSMAITSVAKTLFGFSNSLVSGRSPKDRITKNATKPNIPARISPQVHLSIFLYLGRRCSRTCSIFISLPECPSSLEFSEPEL